MEAKPVDYRASELTAAIANRVQTLRKERRLTNRALADGLNARGITSWNGSTVSKLETGRREAVTADELVALADVLEVEVADLLVDKRDDGTAKQRLRRVRRELVEIERMMPEGD